MRTINGTIIEYCLKCKYYTYGNMIPQFKKLMVTCPDQVPCLTNVGALLFVQPQQHQHDYRFKNCYATIGSYTTDGIINIIGHEGLSNMAIMDVSGKVVFLCNLTPEKIREFKEQYNIGLQKHRGKSILFEFEDIPEGEDV